MKVPKNTALMIRVKLLFFLTLGISLNSVAQNWREMINDPAINFRDVQDAFYAEFGDSVGGKGTGWKQFKRWEWFMEQRLNDEGEMPNHRLIYEELKRAQLQQQFRGGSGNWQLIGPIDEPQNHSGQSIGRVSAIAFHPTDTNQMWAGAPSGGLWKSVDNGQSWETLTDDLPNLGVSEVVVHPYFPDTMYLSTGDGSSSDTYTYGVLKSVDGGQTWDTTGLSFGLSQSRNIRRLLLDSSNTNVLIAAATNGIYRSADAGVTWSQVQAGNFCDLEFKPSNSDTVYASRANSSGPPFFLSYDNGQSWNASSNGMSASGISRMKIAVSPNDPNVVYAVAGANDQSLEGVYRSSDSGENWSLQTNTPNMMSGDQFGAEGGGQAWYSMDIAVDPFNVNHVKVGGINVWESFDGGSTFQLDAHWTGANGTYVHADQHRLIFHPSTGQFYAGNDGGVYRRSYYFNGYEIISTEMSITQFYRLANSASDPTIIMGGAQDNGTFRWKNTLWQAVFGGDGMETMIHPSNPNIVYCTIQRGELHKSLDGGNDFGDNIAPAEGAWVTPFMMEPGEPEVIYAASGSKVYRSDQGGAGWWEFSPTIASLNSGPLVLLDVAHSNTEFVVSGSSRTLYLTKDLGSNWSNIVSGLPALNMTYVAFDPLDENTIWVTMSGYTEGKKVYRTQDAGETWENMTMNLPNLPANCIEIERSSTGGVYVGTDVGVYYWDRDLTEWEPYMTGLPNVIVNELEIQEDANMIRAATYGRGIWESETRNFINVGINEFPTEISKVKIWPNPVQDNLNILFEVSGSDFDIVDAYGRTVRASVNASQKKSLQIDIQRLANGVYYLRSASGKLIGRFIAETQ